MNAVASYVLPPPPNSLRAARSQLAAIEAEMLRRALPDRIEASIPLKARALCRPARYKGLHGGRGSAKSHTFARLLIAKALRQRGLRWLCGREIQLSLQQSVKKLLEDLIHEYDLENAGFEIQTSVIRTPGDGILLFNGLQNHTVDSIKSLEGLNGVWVEEAQQLSKTSMKLLTPTIREPGSELWFSWNPETPKDPVDVLLRCEPKPPDTIVVELNYQDNPHFPDVLRADLDADYARDPEDAAHVWGGKYRRRSKASVFKHWHVADFATPADAAFLFGGDWGFSVDPTVLTRSFVAEGALREDLMQKLGLSGLNQVLCIDAEVYEVGCEIDDTPALFDALDGGMARAWEIVADSARPETISYMKAHGYPRIVAARKGAGSVEEGIKFLQRFDIVVHRRCPHTIDELTDYAFKVHPLTSEVMPILEDKKNHVIDAVRYSVEKLHLAGGWVTW